MVSHLLAPGQDLRVMTTSGRSPAILSSVQTLFDLIDLKSREGHPRPCTENQTSHRMWGFRRGPDPAWDGESLLQLHVGAHASSLLLLMSLPKWLLPLRTREKCLPACDPHPSALLREAHRLKPGLTAAQPHTPLRPWQPSLGDGAVSREALLPRELQADGPTGRSQREGGSRQPSQPEPKTGETRKREGGEEEDGGGGRGSPCRFSRTLCYIHMKFTILSVQFSTVTCSRSERSRCCVAVPTVPLQSSLHLAKLKLSRPTTAPLRLPPPLAPPSRLGSHSSSILVDVDSYGVCPSVTGFPH